MPTFRSSTSYDDTQSTPPFRKDTQYSPQASQDMLTYRRSIPMQDSHGNNTPHRQPGSSDATMMHGGGGVGVGVESSTRVEPTPDPLTRAFNEAIKPYVEQIDTMDAQMADLHLRIQQLEDERSQIHQWIDKRGFRPGMSTPAPPLPLPSVPLQPATLPPPAAPPPSTSLNPISHPTPTDLHTYLLSTPQTSPPTSPKQWTPSPTAHRPSTSNSTAK